MDIADGTPCENLLEPLPLLLLSPRRPASTLIGSNLVSLSSDVSASLLSRKPSDPVGSQKSMLPMTSGSGLASGYDTFVACSPSSARYLWSGHSSI
jgi:hypothetical protein